jgi:hypothetical protein
MKETILFGNKEDFAIELGFTKTKWKFKLCFWISEKRLGNFSKAGELKYSIKAYRKFIDNKDFYYLPLFDELTPSQIFDYLVNFDLIYSTKENDIKESDKRIKFYLFFGEQFANETGGFLLLYKKGSVVFVVKRPMDGPIETYEIDFTFFCSIFDQYIEYCVRTELG